MDAAWPTETGFALEGDNKTWHIGFLSPLSKQHVLAQDKGQLRLVLDYNGITQN